jgi:parvulin-like peptidyl-prolyl isomerase
MGMLRQEPEEILRPMIDKLIDRYLVIEYGKKAGLSVSDNELETAVRSLKADYTEDVFQDVLLQGYIDFEDWKEALREHLLFKKIMMTVSEPTPPLTYQEIKAYFDAHQEDFTHPEMVKFRQIFTMTRAEADGVLKRLGQEERFEDLAEKYSVGPEAQNGGEVGWVARGQLDESMEHTLFSLPVGEIGPVTKTPYGYHIFQVLSRRPEGVHSLLEVIKEIESRLLTRKKETLQRNWLRQLKDACPVEVHEEVIEQMEIG